MAWMQFHYSQLHHSARVQFYQLLLLQELLAPGGLDKPFSALYGVLLGVNSPKVDRLWEIWKINIPSLNKEDWEDCLERGLKLVISSRDK